MKKELTIYQAVAPHAPVTNSCRDVAPSEGGLASCALILSKPPNDERLLRGSEEL